jgi:hypothetical protein
MRQRGLSQAAIEAALLQENATRCNPPLEEAEVRRIAESVARYAPGGNSGNQVPQAGPRSSGLRALKENLALKPTPSHVVSDHERGEAVLVNLGDVEARPVAWLSEGRIVRNGLNLVVGDPGNGKTFVALDMAASISRGTPLFGEETGWREPGRVLWLGMEDSLEHTIRPRLDKLGADPAMVEALTMVREHSGRESVFSLARHIDILDVVLAQGGFKLLVVDPVNAFLGLEVDSHKDAAVRTVLGPLAALADRHAVAVVGIVHLTKGGRDKAIYRTQGSIAYMAAARVVLLVGKAQETSPTRRHLVVLKCNLAPLAPTLSFDLEGGTVTWTGESQVTAADLLAPEPSADGGPSSLERAGDYLREALVNGPRRASEMTNRRPEGVSERTLDRARERLQVVAFREGEAGKRGGGSWFWRLTDNEVPESSQEELPIKDDKDAKVEDLAPLIDSEFKAPSAPPPVGTLNPSAISAPDQSSFPKAKDVSAPPHTDPSSKSPSQRASQPESPAPLARRQVRL